MPEWRTSLPVSRPGSSQADTVSVSYGDYFEAVTDFLMAGKSRGLLDAVSRQSGRATNEVDLDHVDITIQKHGAFYHPARIDVHIGHRVISLVVNVAVSIDGRAALRREFDLLNRLNRSFSQRYIPAVYCQADIERETPPYQIPMFLGEWLSGFHEFHIHTTDDRHSALRVWDPKQAVNLEIAQKVDLYRQVAEILTYYYNPETFEQIFPWHHAAGDFVVRRHEDRLAVRLITVRGYASLVEAKDRDSDTILDALFRFFAHLSLRTRIDRVDGTGDLCWADETAVEGTLCGFFNGLAAKEGVAGLPEAPQDLMKDYLLRHSLDDLTTGIEAIISAYPSKSPQRPLMVLHRDRHAQALFSIISEYSFSNL